MDLFVKRGVITLQEFLDSPSAVDLRMNFQERMFVMQVAVGVRRSPPQVQSDAIVSKVGRLLPLICKCERVKAYSADLVITRNVERCGSRKFGEPVTEPVPLAEHQPPQVDFASHTKNRNTCGLHDDSVKQLSRFPPRYNAWNRPADGHGAMVQVHHYAAWHVEVIDVFDEVTLHELIRELQFPFLIGLRHVCASFAESVSTTHRPTGRCVAKKYA